MTDSGEQPSPSNTTARPGRPRSNWTAGRVIATVFASIGGLIGPRSWPAASRCWPPYAFDRDDDGYFTSDRKHLDSATYAITTKDIDLGVGELDWAPDKVLGNVRVQVESDKPVFVGIGSDEDVDRYLGDVAYDELIDVHGDDAELDLHKGRGPRTPPANRTSGSPSPRAPASRRSPGMPSSLDRGRDEC